MDSFPNQEFSIYDKSTSEIEGKSGFNIAAKWVPLEFESTAA